MRTKQSADFVIFIVPYVLTVGTASAHLADNHLWPTAPLSVARSVKFGCVGHGI